jgi:predicted ATPase
MGNKTYYTQLRLDPLGRETADEMLAALLGNGGELAPLRRLIIERTEGNPFFMEEMVQALFEQRVLVLNGVTKLAKPLEQIRVPPTVQAVLASRIDRLPAAEKELLQILAVLGRDFSLGLIKRVVGKSEDELERMLSALQLAEFIYEQPAVGDIEYQFKHALTQEVAYNSVLTERRRMLHERAGHATEELYADQLQDRLTELAHHFERSGNVPKAVEYLGRTGARAAQQAAHSEAIAYFSRALKLLKQMPEGVERDRQELDLQMALSWSLFVAKGPHAPELESVLVRACDLGEQLRENTKLMEAQLALAFYHRRDFGLTLQLAERVLAMAQQAKAPAMLAGAHYVLGLVRSATGQFLAAREHLERSVELFGADPSRYYGVYFSQAAPHILLNVMVILGYLSTALSRAHELLAAARRSSDPYTIATALAMNAFIHLPLRDTGVAAERADEILSIATEHEMPLRLIAGTFLRGWAMAAAGRGDEGIAEMRRSISDPAVAEAFASAVMLVTLAETCGKNRRVEEALDFVKEGLATAEQTGLRMAEAELHRVKGELLMIKDFDNRAQAERCLRTAIEVARRQGARLFELRATVSLAHLLASQGEPGQARQMLAEIYNWFTEGLEFADLKEAKALLDELNT